MQIANHYIWFVKTGIINDKLVIGTKSMSAADLFELAKVFVLTQAFQVSHRLGVVEAVFVVDFTVTS